MTDQSYTHTVNLGSDGYGDYRIRVTKEHVVW